MTTEKKTKKKENHAISLLASETAESSPRQNTSRLCILTHHTRPTMFAVKGWSVSADQIKPEVASAPPADAAAAPKKSKKRKRKTEDVTSSNVADLWERVIEHKAPQSQHAKSQAQGGQPKDKKGKKDKKRQKLNSDDETSEKPSAPEVASTDQDATPSKSEQKLSKKEKKEKKKDRKDKHKDEDAAAGKKSSSKTPAPSAPAPAPAKLTPLQASMREKLISARFRHLNETLYTRPSADALSLFSDAPEMFSEYHEGFRRQVEVWPENPVEGYLADIRARARARPPPRGAAGGKDRRGGDGDNDSNGKKVHQRQHPEVQPLPRNRATNVCTIADLGCGDARLAAELQADKARLRVDVLSFDLHSPSPLVTRADVANLPLASATVDVAIFCLALMGTNWVDFVEEAYRVLRWKGELWVAEIKSRFAGGGAAQKGKVVEHSVGHRRKPAAAAAGKKAGKEKDGATEETALLVEVDGVDDTRQQTDVSAFVDVLNKRGFMLVGQDQGQGADAIDLSNKMFVKMRFIKTAPAVKGKCVRKEEEERSSKLGGKMPFMAKKPKFIDAGEEVNEAAVLKPCVYKIR